ncbi:hypothetical protein LGL55_05570 [Clostridium tagluense]|uniref:hypothetical protein n=1 Tax=Clostridium tagluense TaxID=360422 RepID=UPI001C0AE94A|nr:hypothetical protein [Clostridium tagluense]MBU3126915.1 hypothetical protein [Clostridium tagluense]MCB2310590.1 hypothetical protein [Clostridium tagluense]MCB2315244.1 hypothetical protein [Clostridium tagluense]MCB2320095.1 hypothetical protein [Clostridium tagluense]MCB2324986.1 hypothetical protein [Clostridium tagluense]
MSDIDYNNKNYLNKAYKNFSELVYVVSTKELQYFITKGEFTSFFNYKMRKMLSEISDQKNGLLDASIFFNTEGEITLIDAEIIGKFIQDNYVLKMLEYYKNTSLNKIIREVVNGSEKAKGDYILISYSILYNTLNELYKTISCKKANTIVYKNRYELEGYYKEDCTMVIAVLLILEDLCKYIGVDRHKMLKEIKEKKYK